MESSSLRESRKLSVVVWWTAQLYNFSLIRSGCPIPCSMIKCIVNIDISGCKSNSHGMG